jgi:hypothetical protein
MLQSAVKCSGSGGDEDGRGAGDGISLLTPDKPAVGELGKVDLRIKPWGSISVDGVAKGASP